MKRKTERVLAALMAATMLAGCGATSKTEKTEEIPAEAQETALSDSADESSDGPVEISYATFMVGSHASAEAETEVINAFNEQYEGKIKVVVEELPSDDAYVDKMKVLAASKSLPDVLIGKNGIRELAIENGQATDIKPYLDEDAEWMKYVGEGAASYNTTEDGKIYSISNQRQLIGYFYNKEMFDAVGITPAKTWDEFMENNKKLKDAGYTPLSLMTGENCWTTNLLLGAYVGTDGDEGNKFMNTFYPESYNTDSMVNGLEMIKTCLTDYSTPDAVGAIYANAANSFEQGQTAMIPNGPWMCPDFTDETKSLPGFGDKVGVALYPGDGLFTQYEVGYILCTEGKSDAEKAAALEFLKFKTGAYAQSVFLEKAGVLPLTENVALSDEYKAANPLLVDLIEQSANAKYTFGNFDNQAYSSVMDEFAVSYPELVYGEISAADMAQNLTDAIAKNK
ncbi:ABC transporter substrate-binding protein [Butyrivibrio sp. MC2013]|uniref:ABC transporter substrate-binding protein n=1 Tax=Butyrivibrio sp. MC2013 TaxID=1280686 RepID=UPI0004156F59|nr:extracellular solute-binding protein [Butyrivibrio sp. MC2013]